MKTNKIQINDRLALMISFLLGAVFFLAVYGWNILNPCNTSWLLGGDLEQHYLGWVAFRQDKWQFPIGLFNRLTYPNSISIIYTDSIPVMAVLFKLLSPILPEQFQYWGIWGLLCISLQGLFGARILQRYFKNNISVIAGSVFFILSPVIYSRLYGHEALAAHWLILAALCELVWRTAKRKKLWKQLAIWGVLGTLTVSIHLYFLLMLGCILVICVGYDFWTEHTYLSVLLIVSYILCAFFTLLLLGGFHCYGSSMSSGGLGMFSFNLLAWFNPMGASRFLRDLPCGEYQYEGFAYLGAGVIALWMFLIVGIIAFFVRAEKRKPDIHFKLLICCGVMSVVIVILAASPKVMLLHKVIIDYTEYVPEPVQELWGIFRSSGRLIWPVNYMIFIFGLAGLSQFYKGIKRNMVLLLCLALQFVDIGEYCIAVGQSRNVYAEVQAPFDEKTARAIETEGYRHIVFDSNLWLQDREYYLFGRYALEHQMTLNYFWLVHNTGYIEPFREVDTDSIYVFGKEDFVKKEEFDLKYYDIGEYIIGVMEPLQGLQRME